jgi:YHS domain-containing protein
MKKFFIILVATLFLFAMFAVNLDAQEKKVDKKVTKCEHTKKCQHTSKGHHALKCPVNGELIKDVKTAPFSEYKGKKIYFCCNECKAEFDKDPGKIIKKMKEAHKKHAADMKKCSKKDSGKCTKDCKKECCKKKGDKKCTKDCKKECCKKMKDKKCDKDCKKECCKPKKEKK